MGGAPPLYAPHHKLATRRARTSFCILVKINGPALNQRGVSRGIYGFLDRRLIHRAREARCGDT